jgi:hypothetical protein
LKDIGKIIIYYIQLHISYISYIIYIFFRNNRLVGENEFIGPIHINIPKLDKCDFKVISRPVNSLIVTNYDDPLLKVLVFILIKSRNILYIEEEHLEDYMEYEKYLHGMIQFVDCVV